LALGVKLLCGRFPQSIPSQKHKAKKVCATAALRITSDETSYLELTAMTKQQAYLME
jgi:hypothetical protein